MKITRRAIIAGASAAAAGPFEAAPSPDEPHIGSLYPFVQAQANRQRQTLSFLRPEFKDLKQWKARVRKLVLDHLFYAPPPVQPAPQLISRTDRGDFTEEYLTFQTTPDIRVPAFVLVPKNARRPAPAIVALHDHGGFYLWGKEKILEHSGEHPALTEFRNTYYGGKSTTAELARRGYVVIVIDMFYWGERRMTFASDPESYRLRPADMTQKDVQEYNRRSGQNEQLVARSLYTAGISWPGVMLWDDMRTVDYLASRPEVNPERIGCVGLSVGGYRSFMLGALDERIKAAVDVGWMTSFATQIRRHVIHSVGLTFHVPGMLAYADLPDLAALVAPRALMVINGSKDGLFTAEGVAMAFDKIGKIYAKAGAPDRRACVMYDGPHEFNRPMQEKAWEWLERWV